jgi:hypothetical protein
MEPCSGLCARLRNFGARMYTPGRRPARQHGRRNRLLAAHESSLRGPPQRRLQRRTEACAERYDKERLPQFDRIPSSKRQVLPLIVKFGLAGRSAAVFTKALGAQRHHGHVAMLVNEHSASAAEMVAAFASGYQLATLVGTTTAGRLVATSAFKVGFGYRVVMPVATDSTWRGTQPRGTRPPANDRRAVFVRGEPSGQRQSARASDAGCSRTHGFRGCA